MSIVLDWWLRTRRFILKRDLLLAAALVLLCIGTGLLLGWENNKVVPTNAHQLSVYTGEVRNPLRFMAGWDGPIYINIAQHGYVQHKDPAFFPLYPLLIRLVSLALRSPLDSGLAIAWASLIGAIYFYLRILKQLFGVKDNRDAVRGVLLFVFFPTGVFLLAAYTESLFAFLALGALYFALCKKPMQTALFTLFATATHLNGVFVLLLAGMVLYEQKERLRNIAGAVVVGSLGLVAYMGFLAERYHNPLQFIAAQRANGWLRQTNYLQHLLADADVFNLLAMLLIVCAVIYWWKRWRSFSIYAALYLCIPLVGGQFAGFNRYSLMAFPVPLMLYGYCQRNKAAYPLILALLAVCWGYFMLQLAGGYIGG